MLEVESTGQRGRTAIGSRPRGQHENGNAHGNGIPTGSAGIPW